MKTLGKYSASLCQILVPDTRKFVRYKCISVLDNHIAYSCCHCLAPFCLGCRLRLVFLIGLCPSSPLSYNPVDWLSVLSLALTTPFPGACDCVQCWPSWPLFFSPGCPCGCGLCFVHLGFSLPWEKPQGFRFLRFAFFQGLVCRSSVLFGCLCLLPSFLLLIHISLR